MSEMRTFRLDKLVRDKIVELTEADGGTVQYEVLRGRELAMAQLNKMDEELAEVKEKFYSGQDISEEIVDLIQLAKEINGLAGRSYMETEGGRARKESRVGGFVAGHFVHTVTVPADSEWAGYYASHPARFPEITG